MALFVTDLDDVVYALVSSICDFTTEELGMDIQYNDFDHFRFWEHWGVSEQECDKILDLYFASKKFLQLKPRADAIVGLNSLHYSGVKLASLSARHDEIRKHSTEKLVSDFPNLFESITFSGNILTTRSSGKGKLELLAELEPDFYAEDSDHYAPGAAEIVRHCVYLFRHPWNRGLVLPNNVIEVDTWFEVTSHVRTYL
jgi:hypothetical protein